MNPSLGLKQKQIKMCSSLFKLELFDSSFPPVIVFLGFFLTPVFVKFKCKESIVENTKCFTIKSKTDMKHRCNIKKKYEYHNLVHACIHALMQLHTQPHKHLTSLASFSLMDRELGLI